MACTHGLGGGIAGRGIGGSAFSGYGLGDNQESTPMVSGGQNCGLKSKQVRSLALQVIVPAAH